MRAVPATMSSQAVASGLTRSRKITFSCEQRTAGANSGLVNARKRWPPPSRPRDPAPLGHVQVGFHEGEQGSTRIQITNVLEDLLPFGGGEKRVGLVLFEV